MYCFQITIFLDPGASCCYVLRIISAILYGDNSSIDTTDKARAGGGGQWTCTEKNNFE